MKILVCGGRDYKDYGLVVTTIDDHKPTAIITGGATGADRLAGLYANVMHIPLTVYPANWKLHGKKAGHLRNQQMLDEGKPDLVIAFPGGKGTANMIGKALFAKVPVVQV